MSQYQVEKKLPKPSKKMLSIPPEENKVNSIKKYFVALSRAETVHPTDGSDIIRRRFSDKCDLGTADSSNKSRKRILETVLHQSEKTWVKNNED